VRTGPAETSTGTLRAIDTAAESGMWVRRAPPVPIVMLVVILALVAAACSSGGETGEGQTSEGSGTGERTETEGDQTGDGSDPGDVLQPPTVEQVTFSSGDLTLEGDLHLPAAPGPHPAIVLIHGSGPISRHAQLNGQLALQFGFAIPVFDQLAQALGEAGWVVLTYDKRSCGTFNGCAENAYPLPDGNLTTDAFAADARAGVAYVRTHGDVDPDRVTVTGHSQGSTFVPRLLRDDPALQAGIMLAAPFDSIDQVLADQAAFVADLVGPAAADDPSVAQAGELAAQVAGLRTDPAAADPVGGASAQFWRSWMDAGDEAPAVLAEVTQPVLLLFGGNDWNVPIDQAAKWREATEGLDHTQLAAVECITHALNCLTESEPTRITPADIGRAVDPTVPASMIEFLADT
jgi:pimeloyl-ACP methyl ester carboxylesterase